MFFALQLIHPEIKVTHHVSGNGFPLSFYCGVIAIQAKSKQVLIRGGDWTRWRSNRKATSSIAGNTKRTLVVDLLSLS